MNKKQIQKSIMQNLKTLRIKSILGTETYINKQEVLDLVNWLDEKELVDLPVLPQFVAEWLEECKANNYPLAYAINAVNSEAGRWLNRGTMESDCINQETFARAWLDDVYTVEKEPLYYAKTKLSALPNWGNDGEDYFESLTDESSTDVFLLSKADLKPRTKERWKELNIDESNAIFEKAEDE